MPDVIQATQVCVQTRRRAPVVAPSNLATLIERAEPGKSALLLGSVSPDNLTVRTIAEYFRE